MYWKNVNIAAMNRSIATRLAFQLFCMTLAIQQNIVEVIMCVLAELNSSLGNGNGHPKVFVIDKYF